jgi:hypothetical protein
MSDVTVLHSSRPKARKPHGCDNCGRTIDVGETYIRQDNVFDGLRYTWMSCSHCSIAWKAMRGAFPDADGDGYELSEFLSDELSDTDLPDLFRNDWREGNVLISLDDLRQRFSAVLEGGTQP